MHENATTSSVGGLQLSPHDDSTGEHLPSLAEAQADEFLQWPNHDESPTLAHMGLSPDNTLTSDSSNSPSTSSYPDLAEYDSQPTFFADKAAVDDGGAHSPFASLEEWLIRHPNDGLYD